MKVKNILFWLLLFILYVMSIIISSVTDWFNIRFGVSFEEILFTITSPLEGADVDFPTRVETAVFCRFFSTPSSYLLNLTVKVLP